MAYNRKEASLGSLFNYSSGVTFLKSLSIVITLIGSALGATQIENEWDLDVERAPVSDRCQNARISSVNWLGDTPACVEGRLERIPGPTKQLRVFFDAGHGGKDRGAQGYSGVSEKWLALSVARILKAEMEKLAHWLHVSVDVKMSREEDVFLTLHDRVNQANEWPADIFISLHANWSTSEKPSGFEVYFLSHEASDAETRRLVQTENNVRAEPMKSDILNILADVKNTQHIQESSDLAEKIYNRLSVAHAPNGRGVKQGPFTVLSGTAMPAVLIEMGFVSNPLDAKRLREEDYLRSIASAISFAIIDFAVGDPNNKMHG